MLQAIGQVRGDKEIAIRVMTWLLYAARSLRLDEVAILIKPGRQFEITQKLDRDAVLEICRSFIKLNQQTNVVDFAPFSVRVPESSLSAKRTR